MGLVRVADAARLCRLPARPHRRSGARGEIHPSQPVRDQTLEPRLGEAVTAALRKSLQRDGTYQLATRGDADLIVNGEITRYNRFQMSYQTNDVRIARDFRVTVTAHVTARERSTGAIVLDRVVTGFTPVRAGSDLASSEREALPLLAQDLAKNVATLLVDGTW